MTKSKKSNDYDATEYNEAPEPVAKAKELVLPYSTIEQNVTWYLKFNNIITNYSDLKRSHPHLTSFNDFKLYIDAL